MEEFFFKFSNKSNLISEENFQKKEIHFVEYDKIIKGNVEDIYKYTFPEENFIDFYVNDIESKLKILKLMTYRFSPNTNPKGIIVIFHGLNSHINHGAYNAKILADDGYIVVGYDHRGFGKSEGLRGYIDNVKTLYSDAKNFISIIIGLYPNLSMFVLGMSLGGLISYKLALKFPNEIKGVILLSPALRSLQKDYIVGFGVFLGWLMSKPQTVKPNLNAAMKNEYCIKKIEADPLTYSEGTRMGTMKAVLQAMESCPKTFKKFISPFVIVVGGKDKIIDISAGFDLIKDCDSTDKQLWYYQDMFHDAWNEEEILDISSKIKNWINERNN